MSVELKDCPFCGSKQTRMIENILRSHVQCDTCGATGGANIAPDEALRRWNMRSDPLNVFDLAEHFRLIAERDKAILYSLIGLITGKPDAVPARFVYNSQFIEPFERGSNDGT